MIQKRKTRTEVLYFHTKGWKNIDIARELNVTPSTISYHLTKLGLECNKTHPVLRICNKRASDIRSHSRKNNIPCDITGENLYHLLVEKQDFKCYVTGIQMRLYGTRSKEDSCDDVWSVDRVRPAKGYILTNIVIMSCLENRYKDNKSLERIKLENRKLYNKFMGDKNLNLND